MTKETRMSGCLETKESDFWVSNSIQDFGKGRTEHTLSSQEQDGGSELHLGNQRHGDKERKRLRRG